MITIHSLLDRETLRIQFGYRSGGDWLSYNRNSIGTLSILTISSDLLNRVLV